MTDDGGPYRCTECGTIHDRLPEQCDTCGAVANEFFRKAEDDSDGG